MTNQYIISIITGTAAWPSDLYSRVLFQFVCLHCFCSFRIICLFIFVCLYIEHFGRCHDSSCSQKFKIIIETEGQEFQLKNKYLQIHTNHEKLKVTMMSSLFWNYSVTLDTMNYWRLCPEGRCRLQWTYRVCPTNGGKTVCWNQTKVSTHRDRACTLLLQIGLELC